jgi:hypothetical protein
LERTPMALAASEFVLQFHIYTPRFQHPIHVLHDIFWSAQLQLQRIPLDCCVVIIIIIIITMLISSVTNYFGLLSPNSIHSIIMDVMDMPVNTQIR